MTTCRRCAREQRAKCVCRRRTSPKVRALLARIGLKGTRVAAVRKHRDAVARWLQQAEGLTTMAFGQMVYRRGYTNGYRIGERKGAAAGYARGFEEGQRQARFERAMGRPA